jgi:hypothetical protein
MANTRKKQAPRKKVAKKRIVRKSPEPLTKLDVFYASLHECYKAARKAGFSEAIALYLMSEKQTLPDWIVGDGAIIPSIDPTDDEEDFD